MAKIDFSTRRSLFGKLVSGAAALTACVLPITTARATSPASDAQLVSMEGYLVDTRLESIRPGSLILAINAGAFLAMKAHRYSYDNALSRPRLIPRHMDVLLDKETAS